MSTGLKKWFQEDWVDIGAPKKGGGFKKCGESLNIFLLRQLIVQ